MKSHKLSTFAAIIAINLLFSVNTAGSSTLKNEYGYDAGLAESTAPVATNDVFYGPIEGFDFQTYQSVLDNDTDPQGLPLTAVLHEAPLHGTIDFNSDGTFTYVNNGDEETVDYFTYWASNSEAYSRPATVTIYISSMNDRPVARNDNFSLSSYTHLLEVAPPGVLLNDFDAEGNRLYARLVREPSKGTLYLYEDGGFEYEKSIENIPYEDEFTYLVSDGEDPGYEAIVTLHVNYENTPPTSDDDFYFNESKEGGELLDADKGVLANDRDPDGNLYEVMTDLVSGPRYGSINLLPDGTFTYQHNGSENHEDDFRYVANDGYDQGNIARVTIRVDAVNDPPSGAPDAYSGINEGETITIQAPGVLANDADPDNASLTVGLGKPTDYGTISLDADGGFTYTHDGSENYYDSFTYSLTDGETIVDNILVKLIINPVNDPPVAVGDDYIDQIDEGKNLVVYPPGVLANDFDPEGDIIVAELVSNVQHGTLTLEANGKFDYLHDGTENFSDRFVYRLDDGISYSNPVTVTITVVPVNDPPDTKNDSYSIPEGGLLQPYAPDGLLANDTDAEGDKMFAYLKSTPKYGTLQLSTDGSFRYQHDGSENFTDQFTYIVFDGTDSSFITLAQIDITPVNDRPIAGNDTYGPVNEGNTLIINAPGVLKNDTDPEGLSLTASLVSNTSHGTITLNPNGSFAYSHNGDASLTDEFTYRVYDGSLFSTEASVKISITQINNPPVANPDSYTRVFDEGGVLEIDAPGILYNDTDDGFAPLQAYLVNDALYGDLTFNTDGSFTYVHDGSEHHEDYFSYRAYDGNSYSNTTTVDLLANEVNDAPGYESSPVTNASAGVTYQYNIVLSDAENDPLILTAATKPAWLTLDKVDNTHYTLSGTPRANDVGDTNVELHLSDGVIPAPVIQKFTIEVVHVNEPPVFSSAPITLADEDATYSYTINAKDIDHSVLYFRAEFDAEWLEFDPSTGNKTARLFGTPLQVHVGKSFPVTVFVSDGIEEIEQSFSIKVNNVNDAPVFTSIPVFETQEGNLYEYNITATDEDGDAMTISALITNDFLSLEQISYGRARLYGTPLNADVGEHQVSVFLTDGISDQMSQVFTIKVLPVNDRPEAVDDNYQLTEGTVLSVVASEGVLQNDSDPENDELRAFLAKNPIYSSAFSFNPDGSFTYQHNGQQQDADQFTYRVTDGTDTSLAATVYLSITLTNDRPIAYDDAYNTTEGGTLVVNVEEGILSNDKDEEDPQALEVKSVLRYTQFGSLELNNTTGGFTYIHDGQESTSDFFTYIVTDTDGAVDTARVNISIYPVNDPPVISGVSSNVLEFTEGGLSLLVSPLAQVTDVDDEQLASATIQITNNYQPGEDSLLLNGSFTGISINFDKIIGKLNLSGATQLSVYQSALQNIRYINTNQNNPNSQERTLSIRVNDGKTISNTVVRTIKIIPVNDPPVVTALILSGEGIVADTVFGSYQYTDPESDPEGHGVYQWYQTTSTSGTSKTLIEGIDTSFYVTDFENGGKYLQMELTPADIHGAKGNRIVSNYFYINAAPEAQNIIISGKKETGEVLTALFNYNDLEGDNSGNHKYQWFRSDTGSSFSPTPITGATAATYTVQTDDMDKLIAVEVTPMALTGSLTGQPTLSGWITISLLPAVNISGTVNMCNDSTGRLPITHSGTYPISFTYAINGKEQPNPVVIPNESVQYFSVSDTGTYSVLKVWNESSATGIPSGSARVSYFADPAMHLNTDLSICANDTLAYYIPFYIYGGRAPYTLEYMVDEGTPQELNDVRNFDSLAVKVTNTGTYRFSKVIDSRGCYSQPTGRATVSVKQNPSAEISGSGTFCAGDSALIQVKLVSGNGPWKFTYLWNNEQKEVEITDVGVKEYNLYEKREGDYTLQSVTTLSNGEGCVSGIASIARHEQPVGTISGNYSICENIDTSLIVELEGIAPWSFAYSIDGIIQDTLTEIDYSEYKLPVTHGGRYTLHKLTDAYCQGRTSDTAYVSTLPLPNVRILNLDDAYSIHDQSVTLEAIPSGGTFSGNGAFITEESAGNWIFYPGQTPASVDYPYDVEYAYTHPVTGCSSSDNIHVFVVSDVGNIFILNSNDTLCVGTDTIMLRGVHSGDGSAMGRFRVEGDKGLISLNNDTALIVPSLLINEPGFHKRRIYYSFDLAGGEGTVTRDIYLQRPDADFSWANSCFDDSASVKFTSESNIFQGQANHTWCFYTPGGMQQVTDTAKDIRYTFRENRSYPIEHILHTNMGCVDTVRKILKLQASIKLADEAYTEHFEAGAGEWLGISPGAEAHIWNLGSPQGNIGQPVNGGNVWYTQITNRSKPTEAYLVSPCFSFEGFKTPMVKFNMYRAFEVNEPVANDGAVLQVTTDGETWHNVGQLADGVEWYNKDDIVARPANQAVGWGNISDVQWIEARHSLDNLWNKRYVRFRFAYASSGDEISNEGMAIDNFAICQRNKMILIEHFTNVSDTASKRSNQNINSLTDEFRHDMIDIQYHTSEPAGDPFYANNPIANNARQAFYGIQKVPYSIIDGGRNDMQNYAIDYARQEISREQVIKSFLVDSKFDMDVVCSDLSGNLNVQVAIKAINPIPKKLLNLYVIVTERTVDDYTSILGESTFEGVFVTMLPDPEGTSYYMSWAAGHEEHINFDWSIQRLHNKDELRVVAFLQDPETREVYQAAYSDLVPLVNSKDVILQGTDELLFSIHPNPVDNLAEISFYNEHEPEGTLKIFASTGELIKTTQISALNSQLISFEEYHNGVYFIQLTTKNTITQTEKVIVLH